jgi:hypothetical protein
MERYKFLQNPISRIRAVGIAQVCFECFQHGAQFGISAIEYEIIPALTVRKQSVHRPVLLNKGPGTSRRDGSGAFQVHNALVSCE